MTTLQSPHAFPPPRHHARQLWHYFLASYLAMLVSVGIYLPQIHYATPLTALFVGAIYLTYCAAYLLPPFLIVGLLDRLLFWRALGGVFGWVGRGRTALIYALIVAAFAGVQIFINIDAFLYRLWGNHIDSFVLNVLTTRGGVDAMGMSGSSQGSIILRLGLLLAMQAGLLGLVLKARWVQRVFNAAFASPRRRVIAGVAFGALAAGQIFGYGAAVLRRQVPLMEAANAFPLYVPLTFSKLGRSLGWEVPYEKSSLQVAHQSLNYPLTPLKIVPPATRYNILFMVCESLRADAVNPQIMPRTCEFAGESLWFRRHYSGGEGTRMGMFSLFYGLHGNYWFNMLKVSRPPLLMDVLRGSGYRFDCRTSQSFTYPEFDRTIFANVPRSCMSVIDDGLGWTRDRRNVSEMLAWIDAQKGDEPFFQFMFFESPHAHYFFPPENAIRKPYVESFDYTDLLEIKADPQRQKLVYNRYLNSCNHLDSQLARVIDHLRTTGLLDKTIIVLAGDHGEEFWEGGSWGHPADSFHEAHVRTTLIVRVPGTPARQVQRLTSHIDVAPTLMKLLGVRNDPADYCLGRDLLGDAGHDSISIFGWDRMAYVDSECKINQIYRGLGFAPPILTTRDDRALSQDEAGRIWRQHLPQMNAVRKEMGLFAR
ncbi:MAG: sulfatase-like hydrolase/transferase [Planctomycetaceae bacterium]|nr:sulfatase-like hydrolase/transferase [Planctomycetaceae bacterium]